MTLDGSQSQREEISWPKKGILKWPLTLLETIPANKVSFFIHVNDSNIFRFRVRKHPIAY
jgi:hypothetical protein